MFGVRKGPPGEDTALSDAKKGKYRLNRLAIDGPLGSPSSSFVVGLLYADRVEIEGEHPGGGD